GEWLAWDGCGPFWAQALRGVVRKSDAEGLTSVATEIDGRWRIDINRRNPDGTPVSGAEWDASVLGSNGQMTPIEVEEIGLGRYRVEAPLGSADQLSVRLHDRTHDKVKVHHYKAEYPAEYRLTSGLPDSLSAMSSFDPAAAGADLSPMQSHRAISHWFVFAAMFCIAGGVLLRRI
ncbi:MAG: hypothetical protein AAF585_29040, partial [Verrucomicrobiota bacterium]